MVALFLLLVLFLQPIHQVFGAESDLPNEPVNQTTVEVEVEEEVSTSSAETQPEDNLIPDEPPESAKQPEPADPSSEPNETLSDTPDGVLATTTQPTATPPETNVANTSGGDTATSTAESETNDSVTVSDVLGTSTTTIAPADTGTSMTTATSTDDVSEENDTNTNEISSGIDTNSESDTETEGADNASNETVESDLGDTATSTTGQVATSTHASSTAQASSTVAVSEEEEIATTTPISEKDVTYTNDTNRYQFSKQACVTVAAGGFYCVQNDTLDNQVPPEDQVAYAVLRADGFSDIYVRQASGEQQITDNNYDDTAPHYDPASETVVWHRNIDDIYQIVSYSLTTGKESIVTKGLTNNMQPVRSGEVTVWQRWVDGVWQVMLQNGTAKPKQISSGVVHNIAPYVNHGYVIWSVVSGETEKRVAVYDIAGDTVSYIDDAAGGQVTNPRFVLMYDTEYSNGDTVTKGFDPQTGKVVPLGASPSPALPDIPKPDPLGETRALLHGKSNNEEDDSGTAVTGGPNPNPDGTGSSTPVGVTEDTAATTTLDLRPAATSTVANTATTTTDSMVLTEYDLPVTPFATTTATNTATVKATASSTSGT